MSVSIELLTQLDFQPTNIRIECRQGDLTYVTRVAEDIGRLSRAGVYLILDPHDNDTASVVYVGKAGKGPNKRFREHSGGYRDNRDTGRHALQNRMREIGDNSDLVVWFRPSRVLTVQEILGADIPAADMLVSTYSLEEEALIKYFDAQGEDLINKA